MLWRTPWAEGLATDVSARLHPDRPLADAMLFARDLAERAQPFVPARARELPAKLDEVDAGTFARFFESGDASAQARGWPARSGHYLGYLVATRLAQRHSLAELAGLRGPALRQEIVDALAALAGAPAAAPSRSDRALTDRPGELGAILDAAEGMARMATRPASTA